MTEAARRAGVSAAAPYRHFADKADLLAAVAEQGFRELHAVLRAAADAATDASARLIGIGPLPRDVLAPKPRKPRTPDIAQFAVDGKGSDAVHERPERPGKPERRWPPVVMRARWTLQGRDSYTVEKVRAPFSSGNRNELTR